MSALHRLPSSPEGASQPQVTPEEQAAADGLHTLDRALAGRDPTDNAVHELQSKLSRHYAIEQAEPERGGAMQRVVAAGLIGIGTVAVSGVCVIVAGSAMITGRSHRDDLTAALRSVRGAGAAAMRAALQAR